MKILFKLFLSNIPKPILNLLKYGIKLLGYLLYFFSGFCNRKNDVWVFGSYNGFNDNSRYLYEFVSSKPQLKIKAIWISKCRKGLKEARRYGMAYNLFSFRGVYYCMIAKVYVFSCYVSDICFFTSKGSIKINLWHGIPIKKIEYDILTEPLIYFFSKATRFSRIINPQLHVKYDLVLCPSKYIFKYSFRSAFRVNIKQVIFAKYPRIEYLKSAKTIVGYENYKQIFLYAPTWRDDGNNFIENAQIDFVKLNSFLVENNSILLIKFHVATKITVSSYSNIISLSLDIDNLALLKTATCLITDYSSIYFDYLTLDRPIIHFCFDLDSYIKNREMYFDFNTVLAGECAKNFEELLFFMKKITDGKDGYVRVRKKIMKRFLSDLDGNNNNYIIDQIQARLNLLS